MPKKLDAIPRFANEAEERAFWESHDSAGHVDWREAKRAQFARLKPSASAIEPQVSATLD